MGLDNMAIGYALPKSTLEHRAMQIDHQVNIFQCKYVYTIICARLLGKLTICIVQLNKYETDPYIL